jgi:hypothetical protein
MKNHIDLFLHLATPLEKAFEFTFFAYNRPEYAMEIFIILEERKV